MNNCKICNLPSEECICEIEWESYLDDLEEEYYKRLENKKLKYENKYKHFGPQRTQKKKK